MRFSRCFIAYLLLVLSNEVRSLIPIPTKRYLESNWCTLNEQLEIENPYVKCFTLESAILRLFERLRMRQLPHAPIPSMSGCSIRSIHIELSSSCDEIQTRLRPSEKMNEQHTVRVTQNGIYINATELWGALHALETIAQLARRTSDNTAIIQQQYIEDNPKFVHRGFLIDTSRHFLPASSIIEFLDAMAMVKMNVLHWHMVDTESFPYVSYTYPELSKKGAYDSNVYVYPMNIVRYILEHARARGIRVMPEFDTPGHAESWGRGYPFLLTDCYNPDGTPTGTQGPINPTRQTSYEFMLKLFNEIMQVFPDTFLHLGGDEVDFDCWKSNPEVSKFMEKMHYGKNYTLLQSFYTKQLIDLIRLSAPKDRPKMSVVWQEVFDNGYREHTDTVIHVWKFPNWKMEMKNATKAGFNVLFSSCWYLDLISYGKDWHKYLDCDPLSFPGTEEEKKRVLGGEAAIWGEYADEMNLFPRSWPRGAAVAERLWSTNTTSHDEFSPRLNDLRCQMVQRGWKAAPINGAGFCPP